MDTLPLVTKLFLRPVTLAVKPFVPVRFAVPSPLAWYVAAPPVTYLSFAVTMRLISPILAPFVMTSPPLATFVICLLPASIPSFTIFGPPVIVTPSVFITVLPVVTLVKPCSSLANLTFSVLDPLDTTPILLSLNLDTSATPPTTLVCAPNL